MYVRDKDRRQHRASVEQLMKEFDKLRVVVFEADLVEVIKQKYGLSDLQYHKLINEAKARNLLIDTSRFGKRGYLKRNTHFYPRDED